MKLKTKVKQLAVVASKECLAVKFYDSTLLDEITKFNGKPTWITLQTEGKSKNANAYMWQLCRLIAEHPEVRSSDIDVYKDAVINAGCNNWFDGEVNTEDFGKFCEAFADGHVGWFVAHYADTRDGKTQYRAYYGSSIFTNDQMQRLVDYVVGQAKSYNIETLEDREIERLVKSWRAG